MQRSSSDGEMGKSKMGQTLSFFWRLGQSGLIFKRIQIGTECEKIELVR